MSRRPNATADRASQNAQTLKALVKLEGNKICADCKRNKHPRWASWNLGIFVCIRCSGIHRGMGTHISRVKSVDLDAWTDEQLQSVIKWGNTRANKYWEAKLAPGHVPSEAKIENFIRTKYDTKRWTMDGPMPDPATLGGDEDVPLNIVQEKAMIERSASQRVANSQSQGIRPPRSAATPSINLFDDFTPDPPVRPSTTEPTTTAPVNPIKTSTQPVPRPKPQESLLGLDFFGNPPQGAGIARPASAISTPASATNARGDLKNSILSLYANTPKPQPQSATVERGPSFGSSMSPPAPKQDAFGGLSDAFGGLSFSQPTSAKSPPIQSASSDFAGLSFPTSMPTKAAPVAAQVTSPPPLSGGSFFDAAPPKPVSKSTVPASKPSNDLDFSFTQAASPPPPLPVKQTMTSMPADLFADDGFDAFASAPPAQPPPPTKPSASTQRAPPAPAGGFSDLNSAFNLSAPTPPAKQETTSARPQFATQPSSSMFDPWGSSSDNNAWGAPEAAATKPAASKVELGNIPNHITINEIGGGWGASASGANKTTVQPTVTADEDFGGWTSAPTPAASTNKSGSGFGGASDPFDNPWG